MAEIYMIRRKTDGYYLCGTSHWPWFRAEMGRTFDSMNSVKIFLTGYMRRKGIKKWSKGRYRFNPAEFYTPSNILMNCEIASIQITPTTHKDIFDLSCETELKLAPKGRKTKAKK